MRIYSGVKETFYKGYKFRSRLEAKWAVYFDACGIKWEYEKEGFNLLDGTSYLPDFWLPEVKMWVEVKPDDFEENELKKCVELVKLTGFSCILLDGEPYNRAYYFVDHWSKESGYGIFNTCVVSNYHNYVKEENRFYTAVGECDKEMNIDGVRFDTDKAVRIVKSFRFEGVKNDS